MPAVHSDFSDLCPDASAPDPFHFWDSSGRQIRMDPPPERRAASKRRDRRRRRRRGAATAADAATGAGSDAQGTAAAAASSSSRRRDRRRRRRRDRAAKAAAALTSPEASVSDIVSIQGGSSQQSGCCLEAVLAHSSVSLPQTTTKKIVNSNETQERDFHAGNKTTKVYPQDGAASYSSSRENFVGGIEALRTKFFKEFDVRYRCDDCTASGNSDTDMDYQNEDPECLVMRKTNFSENSEEIPDCSFLQELEEHKENENGASINSTTLKEEKKKRKKRKGRKRCDRCTKTTTQDCPLSNGADDSGLVITVSEENTSCLPMINSVSVDDAKTKEEESVNLDSTSTERNKLQEQHVACSDDDNTGCLGPYNLAEDCVEKLKVVFSQRQSFIGFPKKKLLILDLNGLLADINQDYHNAHMADAKVRGKLVFRRPYCEDFLKFCSLNFDLGIWSSRKKENVASVVNIVMRDFRPHLLFCWDMSKCTFTGCKTLENMKKPLMLKELRKLWNKEDPDLPWEEGDYSPSNTLLVDDSPYKALLNPQHTAIFPHPYSYLNLSDNFLGPGGDLRVYLQNLAAADDVESYVRNNPFGQPFITESDPHWNFYAQIADKRNAIADKGGATLTCYA